MKHVLLESVLKPSVGSETSLFSSVEFAHNWVSGWVLLFVAISLANGTSCSQSGGDGRANDGSQKVGHVKFNGGYVTDRRDHGRPVALIGSALGVTPEVFRNAFRGVTPARGGPPSPARARANKRVLMDALSRYGVTNERLDEVSDYYRYNRQAGEVWKRTPATATAIVTDGKVTGFDITNAGAGYTTTPTVTVVGFDDLKVKVTIEFSTDFSTNGRVTSLTVVE